VQPRDRRLPASFRWERSDLRNLAPPQVRQGLTIQDVTVAVVFLDQVGGIDFALKPHADLQPREQPQVVPVLLQQTAEPDDFHEAMDKLPSPGKDVEE